MKLELSNNPAPAMVGDGKLPNRYWVTATTDFRQHWYSKRDDCWYMDWAEDLMEKHDIESKTVREAVFSTYKEAHIFAMMTLALPPTPTADGPNSVMIEDRLSGVIFDRTLVATENEWGYTFLEDSWNSTGFTKGKLEESGEPFV